AGETIDIGPLEIVDFVAAEVEDRCAVLHSSADSLAIEYVSAHETPPIDRPMARLRVLAAVPDKSRQEIGTLLRPMLPRLPGAAIGLARGRAAYLVRTGTLASSSASSLKSNCRSASPLARARCLLKSFRFSRCIYSSMTSSLRRCSLRLAASGRGLRARDARSISSDRFRPSRYRCDGSRHIRTF